MKKQKMKETASESEVMRRKWTMRIMQEKGYTENCAKWMALRLEDLVDHMRYGHATIAYRKQDGTFRLATGTLICYEHYFHKAYDLAQIKGVVLYWDVDLQAWRTFLIENFLEWKPTT